MLLALKALMGLWVQQDPRDLQGREGKENQGRTDNQDRKGQKGIKDHLLILENEQKVGERIYKFLYHGLLSVFLLG